MPADPVLTGVSVNEGDGGQTCFIFRRNEQNAIGHLGFLSPNRWSSVGGLNSTKLYNQIFCLIGNYI